MAREGLERLLENFDRRDAEIVRLRNLLRSPLSSYELKLVDKNCGWVAFRHAWNAIIKHRLQEVDQQLMPEGK